MWCAGRIVVILLMALTLASLDRRSAAEAKGAAGGRRSYGGGYIRIGKRGYYSRRTRYYTSGMYWRTGYHYHGYNGPSARMQHGALAGSELDGVLCKRTLRLADDDPTGAVPTSSGMLTFNSTQRCVREAVAIPGDPANVPLEDLMLNRFVFRLRLRPYPTVDLRVFPDKDIDVALFNASIRLRRLFFTDSAEQGAPIDGLADIDLSTIVWHPCTLSSCADDSEHAGTFGRPSSRFLDGGRIVTLAVSGTSTITGLRVLLRFWLSGDFNEDNSLAHVFLRPSLMKVDVHTAVVDAKAFNRTIGATVSSVFMGVEAILVTAESGPSSAIIPVPVNESMRPIEFNPRQMNRVEIGTFVDQAERKGGLLSWWSATSGEQLCFTPSEERCTNFLDWSNASMNVVCNDSAAAATLPYCDELLLPTSVGRALRWVFQSPLQPATTIDWYLNFGYWDINEGLQSVDGAAMVAPVSLSVGVVVTATLLFLW